MRQAKIRQSTSFCLIVILLASAVLPAFATEEHPIDPLGHSALQVTQDIVKQISITEREIPVKGTLATEYNAFQYETTNNGKQELIR